MKKERLSILLISLLGEAKCVNSSPHSDIVKDKPLNFSGLSHFKQIRRDEIGTPYFMGQILFSDYNANILPAEYFL